MLFVLVLVALVVVAIAAGNASARKSSPPAATTEGANNGVWFCPGLPAAIQHDAGWLTVANLGTEVADVAVTDLPDTGDVTHTSFAVAPQSTLVRRRIAFGPPGALTVESFGGQVVVEEGADATHAVAAAPCASAAGAHAYFAAGTTPRGVQQTLAIENPYASDAKVDVTLRTASGARRPDRLHALDVPRRSRTLVSLDSIAVREGRVAVQVDATLGAVAVTQTLAFGPETGTPGVTTALGALAPSDHWDFAGDVSAAPVASVIAVANVGSDDAQVDVQGIVDGKNVNAVAPVAMTVPQDTVGWLQVGGCPAGAATKGASPCLAVPAGVSAAIAIDAEQHVPIVAESLSRFDTTGTHGVEGLLGGTAPARTWVFPRARVGGTTATTTLSITNPGATPAVVSVALVHGGRRDNPKALQQVTVRPGTRVTLSVLGGKGVAFRGEAAMVVGSTQPVFAEQVVVATDDLFRSGGIAIG